MGCVSNPTEAGLLFVLWVDESNHLGGNAASWWVLSYNPCSEGSVNEPQMRELCFGSEVGRVCSSPFVACGAFIRIGKDSWGVVFSHIKGRWKELYSF